MTKELDWSRWLGPEAAPTLAEQMALVLRLSVPAILAEVSSTAMNYIDSAMVGSLGANATAAIGLVSTTTWLFGGLCIALVTGFSVQIAQMIGGGRRDEAQAVLRQGLMAALAFGLLFGAAAGGISGGLPHWLGGAADVCPDASRYFLTYGCALPFVLLRQAAGSMLQCSGDMRTPSLLNILLCALLSGQLEITGLAAASAVSSTVYALLLLLPMQRRETLLTRALWSAFGRMLAAALLMSAAAAGVCRLTDGLLAGKLGLLLTLGATALTGVLVYFGAAVLLRLEETAILKKLLKRG